MLPRAFIPFLFALALGTWSRASEGAETAECSPDPASLAGQVSDLRAALGQVGVQQVPRSEGNDPGAPPDVPTDDVRTARDAFPTFFDFPARGDGRFFGDKGPKVADVGAHIPPALTSWVRSEIMRPEFDTVTRVHETIHGIDANIGVSRSGRMTEGFYLGEGKAARVENPNLRKSQVAPFVPPSLRASRYKTYLLGQPQYEDRPLKPLQEWNSYVHEAEVAVDMVRNGKYRDGGMDAMKGALEFTAYSFSVAMAIEKLDPAHFQANQSLKEFLAFQGIRAMDTFRAGSVMPDFAGYDQDSYVDSFRSSPDAQPLRDFIQRNFGEAYLHRLLDGPAE